MDVRRFSTTLALVAGTVVGSVASASDFRVDTDVFVDGDSEPVSETLTVFSGDVVYDFILSGAEEATVFDIRRGRIVLLDAAHKVKTTLTTEDLLQFTAAIKTLSREEGQEALFTPQFTIRFEQDSGVLELASKRLTYRATGIKPKRKAAAQRFREFADWYARLNAVRPGNLPPFGRLELNQALAHRDLIPEEIERTLVVERPLANKRLKAHSHHLFVWTLSGTDRKRIDQANRYQASFDEVVPAKYWEVPSIAARSR